MGSVVVWVGLLDGSDPIFPKIQYDYKQHYTVAKPHRSCNNRATEKTMHEQFRAKTPSAAMAQLGEELCETGAAIFKTVRFGPESTNPLLPPEQRETNLAWIKRELLDVEAAIAEFRRHWGP